MISVRTLLLAAALAVAFGQGAHAAAKERWLVAKASDGAVAYDAGTMRHDAQANVVTVTIGLYTKTPITNPDGIKWQYLLSESRIGCANKNRQVLTTVLFDHNQQMVDLQDGGDNPPWRSITNDAFASLMHNVVCNNVKLSDTSEAVDMSAALNLMRTVGDRATGQ